MDNKQYLGKNGGDRSRSPTSEKRLEGNWRSPRSDAGAGERQAKPANFFAAPRSRATQQSTPHSRGRNQSSRSSRPRHDSSQESRHRRTQLPTPPADDDVVRAGDILWLPRMTTGQYSPSGLLRRQPWVNQRATNHFVVVWDVFVRGGETVVSCLQTTSFEETLVEGKYPSVHGTAWKFRLQYVPIRHGQAPTTSTVGMPSLELEGGVSMRKQTYAHLDHSFDIEAKFLEPSRGQLRLTQRTLCVLTYKLCEFVDGRIWRKEPKKDGDIWSPLDYGVKPGFPGELMSRVDRGYVDEVNRLREKELQRWTGFESHLPAKCSEPCERCYPRYRAL
jgi:hypothetical protein